MLECILACRGVGVRVRGLVSDILQVGCEYLGSGLESGLGLWLGQGDVDVGLTGGSGEIEIEHDDARL